MQGFDCFGVAPHGGVLVFYSRGRELASHCVAQSYQLVKELDNLDALSLNDKNVALEYFDTLSIGAN